LRSRREIQDYIGIKDMNNFTKRLLNPLIEKGLLRRTFPDKPTSPNQKYVAEECAEVEYYYK
jgi:ATP-dependent DNA helicase RecG